MRLCIGVKQCGAGGGHTGMGGVGLAAVDERAGFAAPGRWLWRKRWGQLAAGQHLAHGIGGVGYVGTQLRCDGHHPAPRIPWSP